LNTGISGLTRWADATDAAAACAQILAEPGFDRAAFALAANMLAAADQDQVLGTVFRDAGWYVATMCAFYLQALGDLTLPRLKAVCAQSGLLSAGRARALLLYLEDRRHFERLPTAAARGAMHYGATNAFTLAWGAHLSAALAAAQLIEPEAERVVARMGELDVATAFGMAHVGLLLGSADKDLLEFEVFSVFVHAYAGSQILYAIFEAGDRDGAFPPRRCTVSAPAICARFGVSRPHLKRIFDKAEAAGLGRLHDGVVELTEKAAEQLRIFYAAQIAQLLISAGRTERALRAAA
jgi:hypothetical protein